MPCRKPPSIWPEVDRWIQRRADVVKDVDAQQPGFAGERVDGDFRDRGAVGEVEEWPTLNVVLRSQ